MLPYEQKTQQSPDLGRKNVLQPGHSQYQMHWSVGIVSLWMKPQFGQVKVDSRVICISPSIWNQNTPLGIERVIARFDVFHHQ